MSGRFPNKGITVTTHQRPLNAVEENLAKRSYDSAQVFFNYAAADLTFLVSSEGGNTTASVPTITALSQLLNDAGFVVWDCQQLHSAGVSEDAAVSRAIEACDNMVVLLSPQSMRHELCLQGLLFAISMNKRIVPLLLETMSKEHWPSQLQVLPIIDLRTITQFLDLRQASRQLIQTLLQDAAYHQAHKQLLVQALRWERQQRNPCLLMRGECLQQYYQWLKMAQYHPQYPPIRLQSLFIEASVAQPQPLFWQVHVIHYPGDAAYASQLSELLQLFSQCTSFDHLNHLMGDNPRQQRRYAIEQAHTCLCIVSPAALADDRFLDDLNYGLSLHKQLVVLIAIPVAVERLPQPLRSCSRFLWPEIITTSATNFGQLFRRLQQNEIAVTYHTQLLQRALQWDRNNRENKLLLNRHLLSEATAWLRSHPRPAPTSLQRDYIQASQTNGSRWPGLR
jgi:hypothetical protein